MSDVRDRMDKAMTDHRLSVVREASSRVTRAQDLVRLLGMANTPRDEDKRIKLDFDYRIAERELQLATTAYQVALAGLTDEDVSKLALEIAAPPKE